MGHLFSYKKDSIVSFQFFSQGAVQGFSNGDFDEGRLMPFGKMDRWSVEKSGNSFKNPHHLYYGQHTYEDLWFTAFITSNQWQSLHKFTNYLSKGSFLIFHNYRVYQVSVLGVELLNLAIDFGLYPFEFSR